MKVALVGLLLWASPGLAAPVRLLLSIGHDVGASGDATLAWAEADARKVRDVFLELGGVREGDAELLLAQPAQTVLAALDRLAVRVARLHDAGQEVMVVVYVSSHAREGVLHLGTTELSMQRLRASVEVMPATTRLLVVDACSSGAATRVKGGRLVPAPHRVEVEPARGTVVITSSGPAEPAQEWDSLKGSLFTHYWLAALRGDADSNRDGSITVLEAYGHAWRQTLARADQHPSFDFDLRGSGELVLTEPFRSPSALSFPEGLGGRFVVANEPDARLVIELERDSTRPLRLAVPPGTYRVRRSSPEGSGQATIELARGTVRALSAADFAEGGAAQVALKGGGGAVSLALGVTGRGGTGPAGAPLFGAMGFFRHDLGALWFAVTLSVGTAVSASRQDLEAGLGLAFGTAVAAGPVRLSLGLVARPVLLSRLELTAAQRVGAVGAEGGATLSLELSLAGRLFIAAQGEGLLRALALDAPLDPAFTWRASLVSGIRL